MPTPVLPSAQKIEISFFVGRSKRKIGCNNIQSSPNSVSNSDFQALLPTALGENFSKLQESWKLGYNAPPLSLSLFTDAARKADSPKKREVKSNLRETSATNLWSLDSCSLQFTSSPSLLLSPSSSPLPSSYSLPSHILHPSPPHSSTTTTHQIPNLEGHQD